MPNRDDWTEMHHLAYVYAAVASSDGSVTNEELEVLCYKLHQWNEDIDVNELVQIVMTAVAALACLGAARAVSRRRDVRRSVAAWTLLLIAGATLQFFSDIPAMTSKQNAGALAGGPITEWPRTIPVRLKPDGRDPLFVATLGDVATSLADGAFDPVRDRGPLG